MAHTPTPEQQAIIAAFQRGENLLVQAGAGCGKTSSIMEMASNMMSHRLSSRGIYITLNKDMAREVADKCPPSISASTIHSLALSCLRMSHDAIHAEVRKRLALKPISTIMAAETIGITDAVLYKVTTSPAVVKVVPAENLNARMRQKGMKDYEVLRPGRLYSLADYAVKLYCMSDAPYFTARFAERAIRDRMVFLPDEVWTAMVPRIHDYAERILADAYSIGGKLPYQHDWYLKQWCLIGGSIAKDLRLPPNSVLFFDEVQDSKPAVSAMVEAQLPDLQVVAVGDSAQSIYGFTGAVDAIPRYMDWRSVTVLSLTTSWRFGTAIADAANVLLEAMGNSMVLHGNPAISSNVLPYAHSDIELFDYRQVDAVICRSNSEVIDAAMRTLAQGLKVSASVDVTKYENLADDLDALQTGRKVKGDLLRGFTSYKHLKDVLSDSSAKYDPALVELKSDVELVEKVGTDRIRALMQRSVPPSQADVTVSTIHKSKGQQWPRVMVRMRVPGGENIGYQVNKDTMMLAYVAVTRAMNTVHIPETLLDMELA